MSSPDISLAGPVLDAAKPRDLAAFYQRLLGWDLVASEGPQPGSPPEDGWALLRSPDGRQKIEVQWEPHYVAPTWPAVAGHQLMMIHLDFAVSDLDEGVAWAISAGASLPEHQPQEHVRVLLDPEGHPFCLFPGDS